ncbi:right-handed parallel beta-helix repeat-containing protein [Hoyosella sp. G463]|uniref:Right-handed parallel beta-helix repeat-containing protein n=1 Tax=Lolliginicoccus lacisalsi TaxID=2742202 RepID=A0A927JBF2_9ACTN|nr:right-handed parallel beta-helix repeat-containing protein [Lolliginicoccus lacisalsi]MBD8506008.1 right-handed parallel beta-helix repeat-containing protein [Lolliginicoccus lacisalsi]
MVRRTPSRRAFLRLGGVSLAAAALAPHAFGSTAFTDPRPARLASRPGSITLLSSLGNRYIVDRATLLAAPDASSVIQDAIDAAAADGIPTVELPPGDPDDYACHSAVHLKGRSLIGVGTTLTVGSAIPARALLNASGITGGSKPSLNEDHGSGSTRIRIPDELRGSMAAGTVLGIEARVQTTGPATTGTGQQGWAFEMHQVDRVRGPFAYLDEPLIWDYPVAAGARAFIIQPVSDFAIEGIRITATDAHSQPIRGVLVREAIRPTIDVALLDAGGGVLVLNSMHSTIRAQVDALPRYYDEFGYGVVIAGASAYATAEVNGGNCRHLFSTLADERPSPTGGANEQWGDPRHLVVRGSGWAGPDSLAVWDTHPYGYDITFDRCDAHGGGSDAAGFQIRNRNVALSQCSSTSAGNVAARLAPGQASGVRITGGSFTGAARAGIGLAAGCSVSGATIRGNGEAGIIVNDESTQATVANSLIESNAGFGVQDQSSGEHTGVLLEGNTIPYSDTQHLGVLLPQSDMIIRENHFRGFASVDAAIHQPGPNVQIVNNTAGA